MNWIRKSIRFELEIRPTSYSAAYIFMMAFSRYATQRRHRRCNIVKGKMTQNKKY